MPDLATRTAEVVSSVRPSNVQSRRAGRRRPVEPGDEVEEGRLAGAVGADQRRDVPALHLEVVDVDGGHAAELADDVVDDEDRVGLGRAGLGVDVRISSRRAAGSASDAGGGGLRH